MKIKLKLFVILTSLVIMAACSGTPEVPQQTTPPELTELMERVAIEDLFIDYYAQFRPDSQHDFASFFAADGRLEVNGMVADGIDEIKAMYAQLDLSKLKKLWSGYCCGSVNVGGVNYKIFGPEVAWIKFFRKSPGKIVKEPRTRHVPL